MATAQPRCRAPDPGLSSLRLVGEHLEDAAPAIGRFEGGTDALLGVAEPVEIAVLQLHSGATRLHFVERQLDLSDKSFVEGPLAVDLPGEDQP